MKRINYQEVKDFIATQSPATKLYIGADSSRFRLDGKWFADYTVVVVVHMNGRNGCRVFGETTRERVYDQNKSKPTMRLMREVQLAAEAYAKLAEVIGDKHVEIHLDINTDERFGSSSVLNEAIGYIKGMTGITPNVKPNALAASFGADRFKELDAQRKAA